MARLDVFPKEIADKIHKLNEDRFIMPLSEIRQICDELEKFADEETSEHAYAWYYLCEFYYAECSYNLAAAEFYYGAGERYLEKLGYYDVIAFELNAIGLLYQIKGEYEDAYVNFLKCEEVSREHECEEMHRTSVLNMGAVCEELGDCDKALEYYYEAKNIEEDGKTSFYLRNNIVHCLLTLGQNAKAEEYEEYIQDHKEEEPFLAYNMLARISYATGDHDRAIGYLMLAAEKINEIENYDLAINEIKVFLELLALINEVNT